jgi:hypothetical protein
MRSPEYPAIERPDFRAGSFPDLLGRIDPVYYHTGF